MIRLLHTGDFHLDSPFSALGISESEKKREELRETFRKVMSFAANESIDIVLISGDLFDSGFVSPETIEMMYKCFASLPCPVVISPGNHDPFCDGSYYTSGHIPDNVFIFSSERLSHFDFNELGISVFGYAFCSDSLTYSPVAFTPSQSNEDLIPILCAHADTESSLSRYAPVPISDIASAGFVYAALGHIHNPPQDRQISDSYIAYCGFPMGRGFDELGMGTVNIVTIDNSAQKPIVSVEKKSFSSSRYIKQEVNVTACSSDAAVAEAIQKVISDANFGDETIFCAVLVGEIPFEYYPKPDVIASLITGPLHIKIYDSSLPLFDTDTLEKDISVRGEFFRIIKPMLTSGTVEERHIAAKALQIGLRALSGRAVIN